MKTRAFRDLAAVVPALAGWLTLATGLPAGEKVAPAPAADYRLSGPFVHENLAIFLIHGPDRIKNKSFLTLQEALEQKKVVIHETRNVNELAIENVSANEEVFVQSGDIIKGGQQDRVLAHDLIVPAKSGKMPLPVFCVEAGRWQQRGRENATQFSSSQDQLATKGLKLANRRSASQSEVWKNVARAQMALGEKVGASVQSGRSASSLQLTLEHKKLFEAMDAYVKKLAAIPEGEKDVIGYAFAINGEVNSADVYASNALFVKLWPKLLKSSAIEAVAELQKGKKFETPKAAVVKAFLADAENGKTTEKDLSARVKAVQRETKENILFETTERAPGGAKYRQNYIKK